MRPRLSASSFVVVMKFMSMNTCGGSTSSSRSMFRSSSIRGRVPVKMIVFCADMYFTSPFSGATI